MIKIDPILAVRDIEKSCKWYQSIFNCRRTHGGNEFAVLVDESNNVIVCLHKWGEHNHPTMKDPNIVAGNGLILYYKTDHLQAIRNNIEKINYSVEEDIHVNPNSNKKEFSFKDVNGYYWTITEFHNYDG